LGGAGAAAARAKSSAESPCQRRWRLAFERRSTLATSLCPDHAARWRAVMVGVDEGAPEAAAEAPPFARPPRAVWLEPSTQAASEVDEDEASSGEGDGDGEAASAAEEGEGEVVMEEGGECGRRRREATTAACPRHAATCSAERPVNSADHPCKFAEALAPMSSSTASTWLAALASMSAVEPSRLERVSTSAP
jgi:hypothetical protein